MLSFLYFDRLLPISQLFEKRRTTWEQLSADVDKDMLNTKWYYNSILEKLNKKVLLNKMELQRPELTQMYRDQRRGYSYRVDYTFSGDKEALYYKPNGAFQQGNSLIVFQPVQSRISVSFHLQEANDREALNYAEQQMDTTHSLILLLNPILEEWNKSILKIIMDELGLKA